MFSREINTKLACCMDPFVLQCGHNPWGILGLRGQWGSWGSGDNGDAQPAHRQGKGLGGSGTAKRLLEVLAEADGDFSPFSPGLFLSGSSRCCKGGEECRKSSGMLLKEAVCCSWVKREGSVSDCHRSFLAWLCLVI